MNPYGFIDNKEGENEERKNKSNKYGLIVYQVLFFYLAFIFCLDLVDDRSFFLFIIGFTLNIANNLLKNMRFLRIGQNLNDLQEKMFCLRFTINNFVFIALCFVIASVFLDGLSSDIFCFVFSFFMEKVVIFYDRI